MLEHEKEQPPAGGPGAHAAQEDRQETDAEIIAPIPSRSEEKPLSHDTRAAVDFLRQWRPEGPYVLATIDPDTETCCAETFRADQIAEMVEWIDAAQGRLNLYYTVNDLFGPKRKKPGKVDVAAARGVHVDVDPRPGEPVEQDRERSLRLLRAYDPPPTAIVDSGNGYQGLWLFVGPVPLPVLEDGDRSDERRHLIVEDRNRHIALALGGDDKCPNIDRLMRLPGTVNLPNKKKRDRGRTEQVTSLVEADWSRRYRLSDFPATPKADGAAQAGGAKLAAAAAMPVGSVDLASLPVSEKLRALILNGGDPDDPDRWADRSDLVYHVVCALIRADVSDGVILAILLDPDLGVSAHVLDQPKAREYAQRQLDRALKNQPRPGPILSLSPMDWARALRDARIATVAHFRGEFLVWDGAAYAFVPDGQVRREAYTFLETCQVEGKDEPRPFVPNQKKVDETVDALKAVAHVIDTRKEPPVWLDGRSLPDPQNLLSVRNGLLDLTTGGMMPADPMFFTRNALDFDYDPDAPPPERWLRFLAEAWPGEDEKECVATLQDFMGYLLTPNTSLQKALLIPGPKRSGKGTIGRVMTMLVGDANTVSPSLNSLGRGDFALQPLLAKQLAIISDLRLSHKTDEAAVAETVLRITGEDRVSVNRKYNSALEVTLPTRFVCFTNVIPKFSDSSSALVSRFLIVPMRQSFYGREDPGLSAALAGELPGILKWAIDGWRRVRANGRIAQPDAGRAEVDLMTDLGSPMSAFVADWCDLDPGLTTNKMVIFRAFRRWHEENLGTKYVSTLNVFAKDLGAAMDGAIKDSRPTVDGKRQRVFLGIRPKPGVEVASDSADDPDNRPRRVERDDEIPF